MKNKSFGSVATLVALAVALIAWPVQILAAESVTVPWSASIYEKNPGYLAVIVDTSLLNNTNYLDEVTFNVTLLDQAGHLITVVSQAFTDSEVVALAGPEQHLRYFKHGIAGAKSATANSLEYMLCVFGDKADGHVEPGTHGQSGAGSTVTKKNLTVVGPAPESIAVTVGTHVTTASVSAASKLANKVTIVAPPAPIAATRTPLAGAWILHFQSDSGPVHDLSLTLVQGEDGSVTGTMSTPDGTPGRLTGKLSKGILAMQRDTGRATVQNYQLHRSGDKWVGRFVNVGQFADGGTLQLHR